MKKRLYFIAFSLALLSVVLALFFGCVPHGEKPPVPEVNATVGLSYQLSEDGTSYTLTGRGEATDVNLVIPSEHEGKPVTAISSDAFAPDQTLVSIYIPATIEQIGARAFVGCPKLGSIETEAGGRYTAVGNCLIDTKTSTLIRGCNNSVIPEVKYIASSAFEGCIDLKSVEIPSSVIDIGSDAFMGCTSLYAIDLGHFITYLSDGLFRDCTSLVNVHIPDHIVLVGEETFAGCTSLPTVYLPDSVAFIGESAFSGCTSLGHINLPKNLTCIYTGTFKGCIELNLIEIPENVKTIEAGAFEGAGLFYIRIPSTVVKVESLAFLDCGLTFVDIEAGVICVQDLAFKGCQWLRQIRCGDAEQPEEWGDLLAGCPASTRVTWGFDFAN